MTKNQTVSLTPENLGYIRNLGIQMGYKKGISQALNRVIEEHRKMGDLKKLKNELLELKHR